MGTMLGYGMLCSGIMDEWAMFCTTCRKKVAPRTMRQKKQILELGPTDGPSKAAMAVYRTVSKLGFR